MSQMMLYTLSFNKKPHIVLQKLKFVWLEYAQSLLATLYKSMASQNFDKRFNSIIKEEKKYLNQQ